MSTSATLRGRRDELATARPTAGPARSRWAKKIWAGVASASLGLASPAPAQRFGFTHHMLPADADGATAVALGDVDGDGDLDAFVGNLFPQNRLYLNGGIGIFTDVTATNLPALPDLTAAVSLGDVDADGDLDAFVANGGQSRLYFNGGTGAFTDVTTTSLPALLGDATTVALGDLDGDGDLDAFVGNIGQTQGCGFFGCVGAADCLYVNDGTGVFTNVAPTNFPALLDNTTSVALGDADGDGDLDALVGNTGGSGFFGSVGAQSRLYRNGGTGVFTDVTATNLPVLLAFTQAVALGDVEGDGDLDAVLGIPNQDRLYLNGGTGVFTDVTATSLPAQAAYTRAVALGDVEGDGDLDAFLGTWGQSRLFLNGGTGAFANVTSTNLPAQTGNTRATALGDLDADGDLDALVGNYHQQNRLFLNDGTGEFTDALASVLPPASGQTQAVALGDVDGDGDLDAFAGNEGQDRLYLNSGTGAFTDVTATSLPASASDTKAVALGDLDGDGDLDAIVGRYGFPWNRLYLNGGTGTFTDVTVTNLPLFPDVTFAVALGDVDGDGDLDAFVGEYGLLDHLYLNGGTGLFTDVTSTSLPVVVGYTMAAALGDVDGDGDLDALLGNLFLGPDRLYLNGGTGVFTNVTGTNLPAVADDTYAVSLGDADGDGDLDAFAGNAGSPSGQNRLYVNGGTGIFTDATVTSLPSVLDHTRAIPLGDADGDGDLDAFVGNVGQNRLYVNGGTGVFTDATGTDMPVLITGTLAVALGDLDGDGDLDAFAGDWYGQGLIYANRTRQLAWRGVPRIGKPLPLDVSGPPGGAWAVGAAIATATIPLSSVGTLRLDPPSVFAVLTGALDPQGRASLIVPVPPDPALVGFSVYWQALVAPPLRLTNLEITTVTDL